MHGLCREPVRGANSGTACASTSRTRSGTSAGTSACTASRAGARRLLAVRQGRTQQPQQQFRVLLPVIRVFDHHGCVTSELAARQVVRELAVRCEQDAACLRVKPRVAHGPAPDSARVHALAVPLGSHTASHGHGDTGPTAGANDDALGRRMERRRIDGEVLC